MKENTNHFVIYSHIATEGGSPHVMAVWMSGALIDTLGPMTARKEDRLFYIFPTNEAGATGFVGLAERYGLGDQARRVVESYNSSTNSPGGEPGRPWRCARPCLPTGEI
jgi:hypothetical protein